MKRIQSFEGLRGYFAIWIVVYHLAEMLGLNKSGVFAFLLNPLLPVLIFFLMSGFVITVLMEFKKEHYGLYIARRYLRMGPALLVYCVLFLLSVNIILDVLYQFLPERAPIFEYSRDHWFSIMLAKATLFYGLLGEWMPHAHAAIIPPAWSVTIEWQFYLIAPWLIAAFKKRTALYIFFGIVILTLAKLLLGIKATFMGQYIFYFMVGIASYFVVYRDDPRYENLWKYAIGSIVTVVVTETVLLALTQQYQAISVLLFPILIWLTFLYVCFNDNGKGEENTKPVFEAIFENRLIMMLGKSSYSFYLLHMLAMYYVLYFTKDYAHSMSPIAFYFMNLPIIVVLTTIMGYLGFRFIESPVMRFSSSLAKRFPSQVDAAPNQSAQST